MEINHTHQYETVDTPIEMNQNPVYSATTATNIEADYYENDDLGPTRNEQQLEYDCENGTATNSFTLTN